MKVLKFILLWLAFIGICAISSVILVGTFYGSVWLATGRVPDGFVFQKMGKEAGK